VASEGEISTDNPLEDRRPSTRRRADALPPVAERADPGARRSRFRDMLVLVIGLLAVLDLLQYMYLRTAWSEHFAVYNAAFLAVLGAFVVMGLLVFFLGWRTVFDHSPRKMAVLIAGTVLAVISLSALLVTRQGGLPGLLMGLLAIFSLVLMIAGQFEVGWKMAGSAAVLVVGLALVTLVPVHEAFGVAAYGDLLAMPNLLMLTAGTAVAVAGTALIIGPADVRGRPVGYFALWLIGMMSLFLVPFHEGAGINANSVYGIVDQSLLVTGAVAILAGVALFLRKMRQDNDLNGHLNEGDRLYAQGDHKGAIERYDMALSQNEGNEEAWVHKGAALERLGKFDQAQDCLEKALKLNPDSHQALAALASLNRHRGKPGKALQMANRALELSPGYPVGWTNKGNALADLHREDEALEAFDNAVRLDPGYEKAWYNKGVLLLGQGRFKEALGCFDEVLDIAPDDERALMARETCYQGMGAARTEG